MNLVPTAIAIILIILAIIFVAIPAYYIFSQTDLLQSATHNLKVEVNPGRPNASGLLNGLIGTFFSVGISYTLLDVFRRQRVTIDPWKDAFRGFKSPHLIDIFVIYLLTSLFTFFWSLLFIIPGIIKSYSYSQAYFINYDDYNKTGVEPGYMNAITKSRQLMDGHKGKLFLLDLSFIGWHILALITCGIGYLWLTPYIQATKVAFYNDLKNQ